MSAMRLSFTTLSCPDWDWDTILQQAARFGFHGIELRGVRDEMYLPRLPQFLPENIDNTMAQLRDKNLAISCLDTSCKFDDDEKFHNSIQEGKDTIDLAQRLKVPYIRVFGDSIPELSHMEKTIDQIARGLNLLGEYARDKDVYVLIETHGDFADSNRLLKILQKVHAGNPVGVLWDINHPYMFFKEEMSETYAKLAPYIKHVHVKDTKIVNGEFKLSLVGQGDLPIAEAVDLLKKNGYNGWLSLEWEKRWHPEIEDRNRTACICRVHYPLLQD